MIKKLIVSFLFSCLVGAKCHSADLNNIIIFIGDGMGFEHVKAAGMFENGDANTLLFESFPHNAKVTTYAANSDITDSGAAATAIATGHKVNRGVISMAYPGDERELETLLEYFKAKGKSTGLVSTAFITHATPAGFGAHSPSRDDYDNIADDYLSQTRPNILFGGGGNGITKEAAEAAGYTVITDNTELFSIDTESAELVSGQFGNGHMPYEHDGLGSLPHLSDMTAKSLAVLDNNSNGFFLMVESGRIDHASPGSIEKVIYEIMEFEKAIEAAVDWANGRSDTLIVVTADHETGGLQVINNNGINVVPTVDWTYDPSRGTSHTAANVPIYAKGVASELFSGVIDNTDIFRFISDINEDTVFDAVSVYPNPFRPAEHPYGVTFWGLPNEASIKIFNIAGELIYSADETSTNGRIVWSGKNNSGSSVASGIYIALIECDGESQKAKLAVIR